MAKPRNEKNRTRNNAIFLRLTEEEKNVIAEVTKELNNKSVADTFMQLIKFYKDNTKKNFQNKPVK